MKDALLPKFVQFQVVTITDVLTGKDLPIVYALDDRGWLWQKVGLSKSWENITGRENFNDD